MFSERYIPPKQPEDVASMFSSIQQRINFSKYDEIPVEVSGNNKPGYVLLSGGFRGPDIMGPISWGS